MNPAVLLLSGGIDSATCGAIARDQGFALHALSFRYGQRHAIEVESAVAMARFLGVKEHRLVDIDLRTFGGSSLTGRGAVPRRGIEVAEQSTAFSNGPIPSTYVPARNTIFLAYALAWAEVLGSSDIFIGVNAVDYSGYPDCRPEYIEAFERMANLATRAGVEGRKTTIHTPLATMTKAQIIRTGASLGLDFGLTHSCYDPAADGRACGGCDSCLIRMRGFAEAGVKDPTRYVT